MGYFYRGTMAACGITTDTMGMDFGLNSPNICLPQKNRWLFTISGVSADRYSVNCLPPSKSARPSLGFKEIEVKHLTESIFYPIRPEFKPVELTLYDIRGNNSPVFSWIRHNLYSPEDATWNPSSGFFREAILSLYDGCGNVLEAWKYQNCWPKDIEWGELDMNSVDVLTVKITLRYARAFLCTN